MAFTMTANRYRDLTLLSLDSGNQLAIACDSSAGIGLKRHDQVEVSPDIMAACCLRVPLFELICIGATPKAIIDVIGNEYEPTGKSMLKGIEKELLKAGLTDIVLNGSTEENMITTMSTVGITVIGELTDSHQLPRVKSGDYLFRLGTPYVGEAVVKNLDTLCSYDELYALKEDSAVRDMLPVGSKGISYEGQLMAKDYGLEVRFNQCEPGLLQQSAGPSTVVLIAVEGPQKKTFMKRYPQLVEVGQFNQIEKVS